MIAAVARVRGLFVRILTRSGGELVHLGAGCTHLGIQQVKNPSGYRKRTLYLWHVALQWERLA